MEEELQAETMADDGNHAAKVRLQRELQYDARLEATAMRTEPLGLDRHCRRYWWLLSDPGFLFVEEPDGQRVGVISTKQQLDEVMSRLNRRGPRERALYHGMRKKYGQICARLAMETPNIFKSEIARPVAVGAAEQPPREQLARRIDEAALAEAKGKLEGFLDETQRVGIELEGADLAEWRRQLAACTDPAAICRFLLAVEEVYCHAGEGLPRDADDATMAALLGEAPQPGAEVKPEEEDTAQGGGGGAGSEAAARVKEEAGAGVKPEAMEVDGVAPGDRKSVV